VILRVLHKGEWSRYRLPKASKSFDHEWNTEWMRIREAQTERYLMDAHGMFYELPPLVYGGKVRGIRPIAHHLRIVPDFCHWRGLFVMASDQTDRAVGKPQSGLWFGSIDDLWKMGKPTRLRGPARERGPDRGDQTRSARGAGMPWDRPPRGATRRRVVEGAGGDPHADVSSGGGRRRERRVPLRHRQLRGDGGAVPGHRPLHQIPIGWS
jgi:hypothetical protein